MPWQREAIPTPSTAPCGPAWPSHSIWKRPACSGRPEHRRGSTSTAPSCPPSLTRPRRLTNWPPASPASSRAGHSCSCAGRASPHSSRREHQKQPGFLASARPQRLAAVLVHEYLRAHRHLLPPPRPSPPGEPTSGSSSTCSYSTTTTTCPTGHPRLSRDGLRSIRLITTMRFISGQANTRGGKRHRAVADDRGAAADDDLGDLAALLAGGAL